MRKRGCCSGAARTALCQGAVASRPSKPPLGSVSLLLLHGDVCMCVCVCPCPYPWLGVGAVGAAQGLCEGRRE